VLHAGNRGEEIKPPYSYSGALVARITIYVFFQEYTVFFQELFVLKCLNEVLEGLNIKQGLRHAAS